MSYWKHPATQEFVKAPQALWNRLYKIRFEMLNRGYNPKSIPLTVCKTNFKYSDIKEWQTLDEQIQILKAKGCECKI